MNLALLGRVPYATGGFGGKLAADWAGDFARVRPFFRRDPRNAADVQAVLQEARTHGYPRAELARILEAAGREQGAPDAALENARRLAADDCFAIVAGQQAGLFGGPLFTLWKALTAVKVAREWNARFGPSRFVPVFWVASDDHDLGEIDHACFTDAEGRVQRLRAAWGDEARGMAAADVSFTAQVAALRAALEALLPGAAAGFLEPYLHRAVGAAFAEILARWLGPLGLVVVQSGELRPLDRGLFARELTYYPRTRALVRAAGQALRDAGYAPGLEDAPDAPHLFVTAGRIRAALEPVEDGRAFRARSPVWPANSGAAPRPFPRDELLRRASVSPGDFSPSAALRPVWQDVVLPVAAAVLGPGEMAYWAQLGPLHDHYGAVWPVLLPRATFTVLDGLALRALRKFGAPLEHVFLPLADLKRKYLSGGELGQGLEERSHALLGEFDAMHQSVSAVDGGLEPLYTKARARLEHELGRVVEKTRAALAQREDAGLSRLEYLADFTRPKGRPQERTLAWAQFAARDAEFPALALEQIEPLAFEHGVLTWTHGGPLGQSSTAIPGGPPEPGLAGLTG